MYRNLNTTERPTPHEVLQGMLTEEAGKSTSYM
jgi:hypothetical protein